MHLEHLLSFPHCVSPMRIMVNNHSYFPIFGHCGWNVPRQVVLCSFCFVFGIFVVCFFLFYLFVWFVLSFFYWMGVWIMEWWSFTILQSLLVSSTYCFEQTLQNAFVLRHDVTKYFLLQSAMERVVANLPVKVHLPSEQVLKPSLGNWMSYLGLITMSFMSLGRLKCSYLRIFEKICNSFVSVYNGHIFS